MQCPAKNSLIVASLSIVTIKGWDATCQCLVNQKSKNCKQIGAEVTVADCEYGYKSQKDS